MACLRRARRWLPHELKGKTYLNARVVNRNENALFWEVIDETVVGVRLFRRTDSFRERKLLKDRVFCSLIFLVSSTAVVRAASRTASCIRIRLRKRRKSGPDEYDAFVDYRNWKLQFFFCRATNKKHSMRVTVSVSPDWHTDKRRKKCLENR